MGKSWSTEDFKLSTEAEENRFDAETYLQFFGESLKFYKLSLNDWVACLLCNNANLH